MAYAVNLTGASNLVKDGAMVRLRSYGRRFEWQRYLPVGQAGTDQGRCCVVLPLQQGVRAIRADLHPWKFKGSPEIAFAPELVPVTATDLSGLRRRFGDHESLLETLIGVLGTDGDLDGLIDALSALVRIAPKPERHIRRLDLLRGQRKELDVTWLPAIGQDRESSAPVTAGGLQVCHLFKVTYPFESSGGSIRNLNTVKSQHEAGLRPYVVTPLGYPDAREFPEAEPVSSVENVPHYRLLAPSIDRRAWRRDRALHLETLATAAVVRTVGAQIIHAASGSRGYDAALKGLALRDRFGIPLVYEVRSFHEHTWGPVRSDALELRQTQLRIAQENRCMAQADHVVTIADAMRDNLIDRGVPPEHVTVIPNAIDAEKFRGVDLDRGRLIRERLGLGDGPVIGYVSNMSRREGHDILIRAFARVATRSPDARLVLVGNGPERAALEELAAQSGIGDRTVFTGEVDHAEIIDYYLLYDVFVVPRRADYASDYVTPLKPFEAMALGRPIVLSDRPVTAEIIGDGERGLTFPAEDDAALAARIQQLLADPGQAATLARAGQQWVFESRTWGRNAARYRDLYAEILDRHRGGARLRHR